jgi:hypothetical protein
MRHDGRTGGAIMSRPARINQSDAVEYIAQRLDFTAGTLTGRSDAPYGWGRLIGSDCQMYRSAQTRIDYVVLSYGTPIAWHLPDYGWHLVDYRFSHTTSRHQSKVRQAVSMA